MYFSPSHLSYSRIDYFIVDKWTLQKVTESTIGTITSSDHAPISITLGTHQVGAPLLWKFNASLLTNPDICQSIIDAHHSFFDVNDLPDTY